LVCSRKSSGERIYKICGKDRDDLIDKYIVSLENLGKAGVTTVCYNFMPVLDWARTDLFHEWEDGSSSLYFDKVKFAYFEIYILKREVQKRLFSEILSKVEELKKPLQKMIEESL
jgi:mannonate dehydratase